MTIITKSMITMSQRARLHDRICPPRNVGTGSLLRSPRFARTKWFLPADLAVAHDPAETESSRGSRRVFTGHVRREEDGPAVLLQVRSSGCVTAGTTWWWVRGTRRPTLHLMIPRLLCRADGMLLSSMRPSMRTSGRKIIKGHLGRLER